jgi:hypothetical protein
VSLSRVSVAGNLALYRADINTADFDADELWFCVPDADALALLSCRMRAVDRSGEFFAGTGTCVTDGSLLRSEGEPGTTQWQLDRELAIDAIEVRGPASASAMVRVLVEGAWTDLVPSSSFPNLAVFSCDQTIKGLELTSTGELSEVTFQGSPTVDVPPSIRIILPAGETAGKKAVLLGTVHDPATGVTVNGLVPRRVGPYFWMSLDVADPDAEAQYHVVVRAVDTAGRTATLERSWYQWGVAPLTVDQASTLQFTMASTFEITGKSVEQLYTVEVNGVSAVLSANKFSVPVPVSIGFNTVVVTARRTTTSASSPPIRKIGDGDVIERDGQALLVTRMIEVKSGALVDRLLEVAWVGHSEGWVRAE